MTGITKAKRRGSESNGISERYNEGAVCNNTSRPRVNTEEDKATNR